MNAVKSSNKTQAPDQLPLTRLQADRLAGLTNINAADLTGLSVSEIGTKFRWQINPDWLLYRQICGTVVKQDPVTGIQYPVPLATVYAQNTVCNLLGLFPVRSPWTWYFPIRCETEVVNQTTTDACGRFCFWVPRFEIEWILRFRLERRCYLQLFTKPTVGNILQTLGGNPIGPDPAPDATSIALKPNTALYSSAEQILGSGVVRQLASAANDDGFGSRNTRKQALLSQPAFTQAIAPCLPKQLKRQARHVNAEQHRQAVKSTLANDLGLDSKTLENLDLRHYFGPFLRCYDVLVPEWVEFFEVPDMSFRVTQELNGTPTTIYSGGLFDVPWTAGNIANVTLLASPIAFATNGCAAPDVACGNVPSLESVGLMPLINPDAPAAPYVDLVTGYATRPNRPHPDGTLIDAPIPPATTLPLATAPYCGTLQLYGCNQVDGAQYYRVLYTHTAPGSTTPSAQTPFMSAWPIARLSGGHLVTSTQVPDVNGWYHVLNPADGWIPPADNTMLQEWDTVALGDGFFEVQVEVSTTNSSEPVPILSATVPFVIDNTTPTVSPFSAAYSYSADMSNSTPVPTNDCVVIDRGASPVDVYIQITFGVTANHLRSVNVGAGGCAGGASLSTPVLETQHWYENVDDNTFTGVAVYKIASSLPQGAYTFNVYTDSRAFNPAGSDDGDLDDWNYNPVYNWTQPSFAVAVVNDPIT